MSASTSYMLTLPSRANQPRAAYNSFSFSFVAFFNPFTVNFADSFKAFTFKLNNLKTHCFNLAQS